MGLLGMMSKAEVDRTRFEQSAMLEKYNKRLGQYKIILEECQTQLQENKKAFVDLKFLKEQNDQLQETIKNCKEEQLEGIRNLLQQNQVDLKECSVMQNEMNKTLEYMYRDINTSKKLNRFSLFLNFLGLCGVVFLFLIIFEIIVL